MTFHARNSCTPKALTYVFRESFDKVCQRIHAAGGDYQAVTTEIIHNLLSARFPFKKIIDFVKSPPLNWWIKGRKGRWVVVASDGDTPHSSHCLIVRDGKIFDNGYSAHPWGPQRVLCAWQLERKCLIQ